jgi:hypothetical protein
MKSNPGDKSWNRELDLVLKQFESESPTYYMNVLLELARLVHTGRYPEEEYVKYHLHGDYASNPLLRISPKDYNQFIKTLTVKNRRLFLNVSFGYSYRSIGKLIGYSSHKKIQKFMTSTTETLSREIIGQLAIVYRVPPDWLELQDVYDEWVTHHFHYIGKSPITLKEFLLELESVKSTELWVRPYIIRVNKSVVSLRVECDKGNFLVEYFNKEIILTDFQTVSSALRNRYKCEDGYLLTVIPGHLIAATVCIANDRRPYCVPIGFKGLNKRIQ